jgi:hypothetical protein
MAISKSWYLFIFTLSWMLQFPKKYTDNRKWNTKRKITKAVAEHVIERDKICIICKKEQISQIHHCYFWDQAVYTENRNDPDQLVWLCEQCHTLLHFDWYSNHYRQECIEYVQNYYRKINFLKWFINTEQPRP